MQKPNIPKIIDERLPAWRERLLEEEILPLVLIGVNDVGFQAMAPQGLPEPDMLKIIEEAVGVVRERLDGLTRQEKRDLLADIDRSRPEDFDNQIFMQLDTLPLLNAEDLEDKTRRTFVKWIEKRYDEQGLVTHEDVEMVIKGLLMCLFLDGYNLAILRKQPLK
jgi:hypothetical protein